MYIPYGRQTIEDDDIQAVVDVLKSDYLTTGPSITEFENLVADYVGAKYAVAISNGTAALHAACFAAGIGEGDEVITTPITFAALIAIMLLGVGIKRFYPKLATRLSAKYNKLWVGAEVILFVLVGATVNIGYIGKVGVKALLVIFGAVVFRMIGVFVCLLGTNLNKKERLFSMMAYTPKATVQAAIGTIPLAMGLECGNLVLTVAVMSILLTAPFGAICVDKSYKKLLHQ